MVDVDVDDVDVELLIVELVVELRLVVLVMLLVLLDAVVLEKVVVVSVTKVEVIFGSGVGTPGQVLPKRITHSVEVATNWAKYLGREENTVSAARCSITISKRQTAQIHNRPSKRVCWMLRREHDVGVARVIQAHFEPLIVAKAWAVGGKE